MTWSRVSEWWNRFFFAPGDPRPLALLRVGLGAMMALEWILIAPNLQELFGPHGFLEIRLMDAVSGPSTASFAAEIAALGLPYGLALWIFYGIRCYAILGFTLGLGTRFHTVLLWITQVLVMRSGVFAVYGVDRYFHLLLFPMMFLRTDGALSLRRRGPAEKPDWRSTFGLRWLQILILLTYLDAGLSKAAGPGWWDGNAIWRCLNMPEFRVWDFTWMAQVPWLPKLIGWSTLFFETFYPIAAFIPFVGGLWALVIIGMHLGIALFMGLGIFGVTMALINFTLFVFPRFTGRRARPGRPGARAP
ncbi:MAG: hypothetical protein KF865_08555 [Bdellovibrionaceae bacterium]|nr:hypothetical protein [Pseudobdellovibrionaceae bacterium]